MLQWKNFHDDPTKPPFPWDAEAARWSRDYRKKHPNAFPLDKRELLRPERVKFTTSDGSKSTNLEVKLNPADAEKTRPSVKLNPTDSEKSRVSVKLTPADAEKPSGRVKLKPFDVLKKKPKIKLK